MGALSANFVRRRTWYIWTYLDNLPMCQDAQRSGEAVSESDPGRRSPMTSIHRAARFGMTEQQRMSLQNRRHSVAIIRTLANLFVGLALLVSPSVATELQDSFGEAEDHTARALIAEQDGPGRASAYAGLSREDKADFLERFWSERNPLVLKYYYGYRRCCMARTKWISPWSLAVTPQSLLIPACQVPSSDS